MTTKTILSITGMSCGHCVHAVTAALQGVAGVQSARVDLESGRAEVEHDPDRATLAQLTAAVEEEGYEAAAASA